MTTTHTPGPWTIYPHTNGRLGSTVSFDGRDTGFTSTDICEIMPEDDNGSAIRVADANARLIAAAPEMAEALGSLLDLVLAHLNPNCPEIAKVRAVLAKAGQ